MKSIIAHKPHLTARIVISLALQILLVGLLREPDQDSAAFNLGILVVAVLAMVPVASAPRWLSFWPMLKIRVLGLFPLGGVPGDAAACAGLECVV